MLCYAMFSHLYIIDRYTYTFIYTIISHILIFPSTLSFASFLYKYIHTYIYTYIYLYIYYVCDYHYNHSIIVTFSLVYYYLLLYTIISSYYLLLYRLMRVWVLQLLNKQWSMLDKSVWCKAHNNNAYIHHVTYIYAYILAYLSKYLSYQSVCP